MKRKLMLLLACLFVGIGLVTAQTQRVAGVVISEEDGQPVVGASVLVKGTTIGTITNMDGNFTLSNIPSSAKTLQVSYIGMQTAEVEIKPTLRIVLKSDSEILDEVVVVAYGTASRSSITGAVSSITAKELEMRPVTDATAILEGAAPGIQVNNTYGEPGSNKVNIRIRGFGSINGTNNPLIVVDGVPYEGDLADINSNDIESMSVLKDASSAALYGNKAANGVVLITTKKGKSNKLGVRANVKQGIYNRGISEYDRLNTNDWMETMWKGYQQYYMVDQKLNSTDAAQKVNSTLVQNVIKNNIFDKDDKALFDGNGQFLGKKKAGYTDLNWNDELERLGYRQEYGISTDAAGDKYDLFTSVSYLDEDGYVISSNFNRFSARLKANYQPTKWFKSGINLSGSAQNSNYATSAEGTYYINPFYAARMMAPVYPVYAHNADGSFALDENGKKQYNLHQQYLSDRNIVYELKNDINQTIRNIMSGQIYGTINFLKDFSFTVKGNLYTANTTQKNFNNPEIGDGSGNNGRLRKYYIRTKDHSFAEELFWGRGFGDHNIDVLVAHEAFKHTYFVDYTAKSNQKLSGSNTELSNFSETTYSEGYSKEYTTESYLGRARYNYNGQYFLDASFRRDGSSRFYKPWGNFWSLGASWLVSKEKFMSEINWVDNLKLRASYGEVGNDAGVDYYAYKALFNSDTNAALGAYYKNQNLAKSLKWETSSTLDIAIEGRLFNRLNFSFDFFDKRSRDLLFNVYNPLSAGATDLSGIGDEAATGMSTISQNIGSVSNRGLEVALDVDVIQHKYWNWNIGMNITYLRNKILSLPGGKDILHGLQKYSEGHSIYEFFTYKYAGVDQMNGRSLYNADPEKTTANLIANGNIVQIEGQDYTYNITYAKKDWCGSALPKVYGSVSTALSYKDISLSVLGTYSIGGKVYDSTYASLMRMGVTSPNALHKDILNAWAEIPAGMTADSPDRIDPNGVSRADLSSQGSLSTDASSRWLKKASYFVLKNINLNYNFPKRITDQIGIGGLSTYISVENAITLTALKGMNPQFDFNGGADNTFVTARVFSFGLNLKF